MSRLFCSLFVLSFLFQSAQAAVTLYEETFNDSGALGASRWVGYYDSNAKTLNSTGGTADLFYRGHINDSAGNWSNNPTYLYVQSRGTDAEAALAMNYFLMASGNQPSVQLSQYQQLSVSWANYGTGASTAHRIAAQVNGQWYVSGTKMDGGGMATVSTLALNSTTWTPLSFLPNSHLAIGSGAVQASALFSVGSTLSNLGFYVEAATTRSYMTQRFGDLTLVGVAVPEPGVWMLSCLGLVGLRMRRSRT